MGREGRRASASEGRWIREGATTVNMSPTRRRVGSGVWRCTRLEPVRVVLARQLHMQNPHVSSGGVFARIRLDAEVDRAAADNPFAHTNEPVAHPERHRRCFEVLDGFDQVPEASQGLRGWAAIGEESVFRRDDVGLRAGRDDQFAGQEALTAFAGRGGQTRSRAVQHPFKKGVRVWSPKAQAGVALPIRLGQNRSRLQFLVREDFAVLRDGGRATAGHARIIARGACRGNLPLGRRSDLRDPAGSPPCPPPAAQSAGRTPRASAPAAVPHARAAG